MSTTGTVYRKPNGRWYVATHHRDAEGRRRQQSHGGYPTRREAQVALTEVLHRIGEGRHVAPSRITLSEFLTGSWFLAIESSIRPSTLDSYRSKLGKHVIPHLGHYRLQELRPDLLQRHYAWLLEHGRANGPGGLSPRSVRHVHATLRRAMRDAVAWDLIPANPADRATPPRVPRSTTTTWTPSEVKAFLEFTADDELAELWLLAAQSGMRRGELLGLRWDDVDLETGHLRVHRSIVSVAYEVHESEPKTARGRRTVPLSEGRRSRPQRAPGPFRVGVGLLPASVRERPGAAPPGLRPTAVPAAGEGLESPTHPLP